jgi:NodT family efflux transporter outer membrane factor (OMF) lipoprotein
MKSRLPLTLLLATCGCGSVPHPAPLPSTEVPARFAEAPDAAPTGEADLSAWWKLFGDPELSRLVDRALDANLDLAQTAERIEEARQDEVVAGAARLPTLNGDAGASRQRISEHAIPLPPGGSGGGSGGGNKAPFALPGTEFNSFRLGLDASWQLDLFGGARSAAEAAHARTGSAVWSRRDLQVSIAAEVADHYLALRSLQRREAIAWAELARQRQLLSIIHARADAGFVSRLDEEQQQSQVTAAEARTYPLEAGVRAEIHALGVLVGQGPEALVGELTSASAEPAAPPAPPPGLPSDLLRRRPDVRRAEQDVAAAAADVGVATADLYPKLTLSAQPDLVSTSLSNLVTWASRDYTVGASLLWPIFEGGRLHASLAKANAREQEQLLAYRQTVLTGLKEVEDTLARYQADDASAGSLDASLASARRAENLARDQYRAGLAGYASVLAAEQALTSGEDELEQTRLARAQDVVGLYKALGGGWSASDTTEIASKETKP